MASALRNIAIVGASGHLGPFILSAVQADPAFNVTVITRHGSSATFPEGTNIVRVGDDYPDEEMERVFRGQDAVVLVLGFAAEHRHSALVQASIKAGVKRVVASHYGSNIGNEAAQKIFPVAATKAAMVKELKGLEREGWSWTTISCGVFFDFCVQVGFFGIDPKAHTATIWDDGTARFSATTRATIGKSVAAVLSNPGDTANRNVYISSFETTMNEILDAEKKATGVSDWKVEHVDADEQIAKSTRQVETATEMFPRMMALGQLALASNLKEEYGANYKALGLLENEKLGIKQEDVEVVVAQVLKQGTMMMGQASA